jgi:hypothetical protein
MVIAIKPTAEDNCVTAVMPLSYILQTMYFMKSFSLSEQVPKASGVNVFSTSQVHASAMTVENIKYEVVMDSIDLMFMPSFVKICQLVQKFK